MGRDHWLDFRQLRPLTDDEFLSQMIAHKRNGLAYRAVCAILLVACAAAPPRVAAQPDESSFNPASEMMSAAEERAALGPEAQTALARFRGRTEFFKKVSIAKRLNFNALHGKIVTFRTVDGENVRFTGELTVNPDKSRVWIGVAESGGHLSIAFDDQGVHGDANVKGKSFAVLSLPGSRYFMIAEVTPIPIADDEPRLPPSSAASQPVTPEKPASK